MQTESLLFLAASVLIKNPVKIPFIISLNSISLNDFLHKNLNKCDQIKYLGAFKRWYSEELIEYMEFKGGKLHGRCESNYKNGKKHISSFYINGEKHGVFRMWYQNGNMSLYKEFKNGKQHGRYEAYYEDGFISETTNYTNGKRSGKNIVYSTDGGIKEIKYNLNGLLHGKYTKWTNIMRKECCYKNGILHGEYKIYIRERIIRHKLYVEGIERVNYLLDDLDKLNE